MHFTKKYFHTENIFQLHESVTESLRGFKCLKMEILDIFCKTDYQKFLIFCMMGTSFEYGTIFGKNLDP